MMMDKNNNGEDSRDVQSNLEMTNQIQTNMATYFSLKTP